MVEQSPPAGLGVELKRSGIIESTVGAILGWKEDRAMGHVKTIVQDWKTDDTEFFRKLYSGEDEKWASHVKLYLNSAPSIFTELIRLFSFRRKSAIVLRATVGLFDTFGYWLKAKFAQSDAFNPWTESIYSYAPAKGIAMFILGEAQDYHQRPFTGITALLRRKPSWAQSIARGARVHAQKHFEKAEAMQLLNAEEHAAAVVDMATQFDNILNAAEEATDVEEDKAATQKELALEQKLKSVQDQLDRLSGKKTPRQ